MPVHLDQLMSAIAILADEKEIKLTVKQSGKGALICGGMSFLGGLLAGPVGLALGGTIGGITAYSACHDFRPVSHIIQTELTPLQKRQLYDHLKASVSDISPLEVLDLILLLQTDRLIAERVVQSSIEFILRQCQNYVRIHGTK